jgi:hypothetical protein
MQQLSRQMHIVLLLLPVFSRGVIYSAKAVVFFCVLTK